MKNVFEQLELYVEGSVRLRGQSLGRGLGLASHEDFMRRITPQIEELVKKMGEQILIARPTMGQTLGNWWSGIKNFAGKLWSGKWRNEAYNAELYNLTDKYTKMLNEATTPYSVGQILQNFTNDLLLIISNETRSYMIQAQKIAYNQSLANAARKQAEEEAGGQAPTRADLEARVKPAVPKPAAPPPEEDVSHVVGL